MSGKKLLRILPNHKLLSCVSVFNERKKQGYKRSDITVFFLHVFSSCADYLFNEFFGL